MARPQQFSEDQALDSAMALFWEKGFHATSFKDLVEQTGVCRASLYKTFGDKENLYTKALQHYREKMACTTRPLGEGEKVTDFLRHFFQNKIEGAIKQKPQGCLFINATTELITKDEAIRELLIQNEQSQRNWLQSLLEIGKERGEFAPNMDTSAVAHYLFVAIQGVTINAMTQKDTLQIKKVIDLLINGLETRTAPG